MSQAISFQHKKYWSAIKKAKAAREKEKAASHDCSTALLVAYRALEDRKLLQERREQLNLDPGLSNVSRSVRYAILATDSGMSEKTINRAIAIEQVLEVVPDATIGQKAAAILTTGINDGDTESIADIYGIAEEISDGKPITEKVSREARRVRKQDQDEKVAPIVKGKTYKQRADELANAYAIIHALEQINETKKLIRPRPLVSIFRQNPSVEQEFMREWATAYDFLCKIEEALK